MGFVSYSEDIDKIRADYEHFRTATDGVDSNFRAALQVFRADDQEELKRKRLARLENLDNLAQDHIEKFIVYLDSQRDLAAKICEQACSFLSSPTMHLVDKLKKLERDRDEARAERDDLRDRIGRLVSREAANKKELSDCRAKLAHTQKLLEQEVDRRTLSDELLSVDPLKRRK